MPTLEEMLRQLPAIELMTLSHVRQLVQKSGVDTDFAVKAAAEIETTRLAETSREFKIAVFLSGLAANLFKDQEI